MPRYELRCRACHARATAPDAYVCAECLGPLEVTYDHELTGEALRDAIRSGPTSLWRYAPLLPIATVPDDPVGWTPLVRADRLARELGLEELWLKNDTVTPSFSFKDRVVAVAAQKAKELGYDTIACASTGNLAGAVAAAAARLGLKAVVFVPATTEPAKLAAVTTYGAQLVLVDGTYDEVNRLVGQIAEERHWAFVNFNLRPYYVEGSKTLLFETAEQLGWRLPDALVIPIASGAMFVNNAKAAGELVSTGLVEPRPLALFGAQPAGCAPVADAFARGEPRYAPVKRPDTIAHALAIGTPADGNRVLELARSSGGAVASVGDDEIRSAISLVARTAGIFVEPAGGTTVAVLVRLAAEGLLPRSGTVVAYLTGNGFKTPDVVGLDEDAVTRIPARLDAFEDALPETVAAETEVAKRELVEVR
ncbi:MAG: threonine synthase [Candidatus Limnocylindria bacterium]